MSDRYDFATDAESRLIDGMMVLVELAAEPRLNDGVNLPTAFKRLDR
jgi:hypothetical protein